LANKENDKKRRIGVLGVADLAPKDPVLYEVLKDLERQANQALSDINTRILQLESKPDPTFPKIDVFERFAQGYVSLSGGTATVYETKCDPAKSQIYLSFRYPVTATVSNIGVAPSDVRLGRFTITSTDAADSREVNWLIVNSF